MYFVYVLINLLLAYMYFVYLGEHVLGKTSGKGPPGDKESWWWNEDIQKAIKKKAEARKNHERQRSDESKQAFKERGRKI